MTLKEAIANRILLLDGGMGSLIQEYNLNENDFRGEILKDSKIPLKGNNDVLVITRPDIISDIHRRYLEAGADIITANTFSSQAVSQKEYGLSHLVEEINRKAVILAKKEAQKMTALTPNRPRFVVGDVGPTSKMLSMSEDVNDPASRAITFDQLEDAYLEQIRILLDERVDAILVETIFDTLNAKAAISAYLKAKEEISDNEYSPEIMLSITVSDSSGRTLSGQTIEAFVISVEHANPLSVGLNCGLGASGMIPYLRQMRQVSDRFISCHPNAGLPNQFGQYEDSPEDMIEQMKPYFSENLVNIIGGCCGTTPRHIAAMRKEIDSQSSVFIKKDTHSSNTKNRCLRLSGLEPSVIDENTFFNVGERCNVAGSRKFLRLISEKNYDEALAIARKQVEDGAMAIDINMDDGLLDAKQEMRTFLNLLASDPEISKIPLMIDSSRFEVIEEGLKCAQGKCIVNSISLKLGEKEFVEHAKVVKRLGGAIIVMCFDEEGQATNYDHRIKICKRAFDILTEKVGFAPSDIIFDPNVLTIATGIPEHNNYALDFIRATEWIHDNLPGIRISGGLSNLSFAFRGNNYLRESMHAVFLYHAIQKGMGMAIMNPATTVAYLDVPTELRKAIEDVVFNNYPEASEKLIEHAAATLSEKESPGTTKTNKIESAQKLSIEERLIKALIKGNPSSLELDLSEAIEKLKTPLAIISGPLMEGMNRVGKLFGEGKMFLPQVVKTARTMKKAVEILTPLMETQNEDSNIEEECSKHIIGRPKILIATVKGDVHDIGKNIVGIILSCNNFDVIDLGVMVPAEKIVETAISESVDIVCISGLITPSLEEMCTVAKAMESAKLHIPIFVGGATTSPIHTAVKIAPLYSGPVFHTRDASQNPILATKLLDKSIKKDIIKQNKLEQERIRFSQKTKTQFIKKENEDLKYRPKFDWNNYTPVYPPFIGKAIYESVSIKDIINFIDWTYFYWAWKVKSDSEEGKKLKDDAKTLLEKMQAENIYKIEILKAFYQAVGTSYSIKIKLKNFEHDENCPCCQRIVEIETPRQSNGVIRKALCDYISPENDCIGAFAITMNKAFVEKLEKLKASSDDYQSILMQTIGDRLVEAAAEYMSKTNEERYKWKGIRPAIGYPILPDQKAIFKISEIIDLKSIGIYLTENGAMYPQSSICGLLISHPESEYFKV